MESKSAVTNHDTRHGNQILLQIQLIARVALSSLLCTQLGIFRYPRDHLPPRYVGDRGTVYLSNQHMAA